MSEPTIRERIDGLRSLLASEAITPADMRTAMVNLTALWGALAADARAKEFTYRKVLATHMAGDGTAARARVTAEATEEWAAFRDATGLAKEVEQTIISCRGSLRSLESEIRHTR